jgi:rhodanese-related sulfurtransferase
LKNLKIKITIFAKKNNMHFISVTDLKQQLDSKANLFLLDIRENYEREAVSIPSKHIPMDEVCAHLVEFPVDQQVILMCNSGKRAEALANLLETEFNQSNLVVLEGGIAAWMEQFAEN